MKPNHTSYIYPDWIDAKTKLPALDEDGWSPIVLLVVCGASEPQTGYLDTLGIWRTTGDDEIVEPAYWVSIPAPPKTT
tara:strand:- start:1736 stop:1969 length:234 start_codon:yes stop_codon:yes gene_type:complete